MPKKKLTDEQVAVVREHAHTLTARGSQKALAITLGVSRSGLCEILKGHRRVSRPDRATFLERIAAELAQ